MKIVSSNDKKYAWAEVRGGKIVALGVELFREGGHIWRVLQPNAPAKKIECLQTVFNVGGVEFYNKVKAAAKKDNIPSARYFKSSVKKRKIAIAEGKVHDAELALKTAREQLNRVLRS